MPILQGCRNGNDEGVGGSQLFLSTQLPAYDRAANHDIEMGLYDGGHAGVYRRHAIRIGIDANHLDIVRCECCCRRKPDIAEADHAKSIEALSH